MHLMPRDVIVIVFLIYGSVVDCQRREIDPVVTALTALAGIIYGALVRRGDLTGVALSLLPGVALTIFAVISRGAVGVGDGLTLLVIGLFQPAERVVIMAFFAFFLSAAVSILLLAVRKAGRRTRIPFLPFYLAATVGLCLF